MYHDGVTAAPAGAARSRGPRLGILSEMEYRERQNPELLRAVDYLLSHPEELSAVENREIHEFIRDCRRLQLGRIGPEDPGSAIRVLGELDILNAYERIRAYYLNCAETLAGGKR